MSVMSSVRCLIGHHEPLRRNVERNGDSYVGKCRHCGKDIERVSSGQWRHQSA